MESGSHEYVAGLICHSEVTGDPASAGKIINKQKNGIAGS